MHITLSLLLMSVDICYMYATASSRPHVILIVADDLGWDDVSFHGSEISTPNIDKLAREGIILNNYYVSPICTPTRGALMTGRNPISLGLQHGVIAAPQPYGLPLNHTTMAQHLKRLDYATHIVGKWHLGFFAKEYTPTMRGFDSHFGYWTGHEDYFDHMAQDPWWGLDFRENLDIVKNEREKYSTELFTTRAEEIIMSHNKSQPLFLYLAHQAVHAGNYIGDPLQAPQKYVNKFRYIKDVRRRIFAGMASALDESIKNITGALTTSGMMNNTIIVFTTDNGGPAHGYDRNAACNWPLRGTKNTLWEGGVRGTSFIYSALLNRTGYISEHLMHVTDWLPTLYQAAGGRVSDLQDVDGVGMWHSLSDNAKSARNEVLHNIDPVMKHAALRVEDYKVVLGDISGGYYDGWYPPPHLNEDLYSNHTTENQKRTFKKFTDWYLNVEETASNTGTGRSDSYSLDSMRKYLIDMKDRISANRADKEMRLSEVNQPNGQRLNNPRVDVRTYSVKCGYKPYNYSTNCDPKDSPCLFNIKSDPCEFNNIAALRPDIVNEFLSRIMYYLEVSVPPVNKPSDPKANPKLHGNSWDHWIDL